MIMAENRVDPTIDMFERLIAQLEKEWNDWARVRAEADEHLAELDHELNSLRGALIKYKSRHGLGPPKIEREELAAPRTEEFSDIPLADACVQVLANAGHPMRAGDIVQELLRRGSRTNSATPYNVIVTAMRRDKRLVSVRRGWWGLAGRDSPRHTS